MANQETKTRKLYIASHFKSWKSLKVISEQTGRTGLISEDYSVGYLPVFLTLGDMQRKYAGLSMNYSEIEITEAEYVAILKGEL